MANKCLLCIDGETCYNLIGSLQVVTTLIGIILMLGSRAFLSSAKFETGALLVAASGLAALVWMYQ